MQIRKKDAAAAIAVAVITILTYRETLDFKGIYDDNYCCIGNPGTRPDKTTLLDMLQEDFWGADINGPSSNTQWRPLTVYTYRMDHTLWCRGDPQNAYGGNGTAGAVAVAVFTDSPCLRGSRGTNLVLGALAAALAYAACRVVCGLSLAPALFGALLFALHPVHIESHATLYGRADVLCAALHLAACCLAAVSESLSGMGAALVLGLLSVTAKESGLATLVVAPLCAWISKLSLVAANSDNNGTKTFAPQNGVSKGKKVTSAETTTTTTTTTEATEAVEGGAEGTVKTAKTVNSDNNGTKTFAPQNGVSKGKKVISAETAARSAPWGALGCGAALACGVVVLRHTLVERWGPPIGWMDNPYAFLPPTRASRWLSLGYIQARYLLWLFCPLTHSPNYGWNAIPYVEGIADPRNALTALAYLTLLGSTLLFLCLRWWRELALVAWGVGLFLPASNVFFYVGTAFADRLLYLPSIPFCLLAACLVQRVIHSKNVFKCDNINCKNKIKKVWWAVTVFCTATLLMAAHVTLTRLPHWRDGASVWAATQKQFPDNVVALHNLGLEAQTANRQEEAAALFAHMADILEAAPFPQIRGDRLVKTGREVSDWTLRSANTQKAIMQAGPAAAAAAVREAVESIRENKKENDNNNNKNKNENKSKSEAGLFALLRDVLLSGVLAEHWEAEDDVLKAALAVHLEYRREKDLFQIVRVHVLPRRKQLFGNTTVPDMVVNVIAPMIDGEL